MSKIGTLDISAIRLGNTEIVKGYLGTNVIFEKSSPKPPVTLQTPFFIEDISGSENTVTIKKNYSNAPTLTIQKSIDGTTWSSMGTTSKTPITATVPANGRLYLRCSTNAWSKYSGNFYTNTISTSGRHNVGGNILSLLYGSSFTGRETDFKTTATYTFHYLYSENTTLVSAEDLLLPAKTMNGNCYEGMFYDCSSLTTAPSILPATTLADDCYRSMFSGCTSLTTAPELPATTLKQYSYVAIFARCTSLTSVTCHATGISANNCTTSWLYDVSPTGTLYTPSSTPWTTGKNGIPEGWTRVDI